MRLKPRELLFYQDLNDSLIDAGPDHVLKVIYRHQVFDQARERPESLFLGHNLQQTPDNKVEALAVADVRVAIGVRSADALDGIEDLLPKPLLKRVFSLVTVLIVLEEGLVGERPWHVNFNLMSIARGELLIEATEQRNVV